jgi:hypothetical protein
MTGLKISALYCEVSLQASGVTPLQCVQEIVTCASREVRNTELVTPSERLVLISVMPLEVRRGYLGFPQFSPAWGQFLVFYSYDMPSSHGS